MGVETKRKGRECKWFLDQTLYWQGKPMKRDSDEYRSLVEEAFNALSANKDFQKALLATGDKTLYHTMGEQAPTKTVLTEEEFSGILTNIRSRLNGKNEV